MEIEIIQCNQMLYNVNENYTNVNRRYKMNTEVIQRNRKLYNVNGSYAGSNM